MKAIALAATVAGLLASGAAFADDAMAPVHQFVDTLNKGVLGLGEAIAI